jgi:hypothetical protein
MFFAWKYLSEEKNYLTKTVIISFLLKILFVFIFAYLLSVINGIPFLSEKDDFNYNDTAVEIVSRWRDQGIGFYPDLRFSTGFYSGFPNISALFMYIFGDSIYIPRIANVVFSTLTVIFGYKTLRFEINKRNSTFGATLIAFSTVFILYSSLQLKDTILLFLTCVVIFYLSKTLFFSKIKLGTIIVITLCLMLLVFFRAAIILPIAMAFIGSIIVTRKINIFKLKYLFMIGFISYLMLSLWGLFSELMIIENYDYYFENRLNSRKDIQGITGNKVSRLGEIIYFLIPIFIILGLFLPIPSLVDIINSETINYHLIALLSYLILMPFSILAFFIIWKKRERYRIGVFFIFFIIFYKMMQSASISILDSRQSIPGIFFMILIIPYFFENFDFKLYRKLNLIFCISFFITISYTLIKYYIKQ